MLNKRLSRACIAHLEPGTWVFKSRHQYLFGNQISLKSDNVEFSRLFCQPFWKWRSTNNFQNHFWSYNIMANILSIYTGPLSFIVLKIKDKNMKIWKNLVKKGQLLLHRFFDFLQNFRVGRSWYAEHLSNLHLPSICYTF